MVIDLRQQLNSCCFKYLKIAIIIQVVKVIEEEILTLLLFRFLCLLFNRNLMYGCGEEFISSRVYVFISSQVKEVNE